jgi:glycosyltransferase involved in cell wall biosynthesis
MIEQPPGFPVRTVPVRSADFNWKRLPVILRNAIGETGADRVWVTNTFSLGPPVLAALTEWPVVWKIFGYEVLCPNYMSLHPRARIGRWAAENPRGTLCTTDFFKSPFRCTWCSIRGMGKALYPWMRNSYSHEWVGSGAWLPGYAARARTAVRSCLGVMAYNDLTRAMLSPVARRVRLVPGGVDLERFRAGGVPENMVLMAGRADDPRKGLGVFAEAISLLRAAGWGGVALATTSRLGQIAPGVEGTGWIPHSRMGELYRRAMVVVVPTLWPEPFGLVALEAMACGRPVVASDIGGLSLTVGKTGLVFSPGDAEALAQHLRELLEDTGLRRKKEVEARAVAEEYAWPKVVEDHHLPLLAGGADRWEPAAVS